MPNSATPSNRHDAEPVIPVIEERARVASVRHETGAVRVRIETVEDAATVALERVEEQTRVQRVPIGEVVGERRDPWWQEDTLVVPVYAEREVVERQLLLVEEIHLQRTATRTTTDVNVPLTRQRAIVERLTPQGDWAAVDDDELPAGGKTS
jgi:stress response protein YsnF